jgi:hypothetical protein
LPSDREDPFENDIHETHDQPDSDHIDRDFNQDIYSEDSVLSGDLMERQLTEKE